MTTLEWEEIQTELAQQAVVEKAFQPEFPYLIGGADMSTRADDASEGFVTVAVWDRITQKLVFQQSERFKIEEPFVSGFLAFREAPVIMNLLQKMKASGCVYFPHILLLDGNGLMHPRKCGLATHVGVSMGIATIGVAKTLYEIDGITKQTVKELRPKLKKAGDSVDLVGNSGEVWGGLLRSTSASKVPVYVSIGNGVDLPLALSVVRDCCVFRVPEPVRMADIISRKLVAEKL